MHPKAFSDGDLIKHGWRKMQAHLGLLIGATLVAMIVTVIPLILSAFIDSAIVGLLLFIVYILLGWFFSIGLMRITLAIADNKEPEFGLLFQGGDRLLPFIGVSILYSIIVVVGYFLLIFPGIIWGLKYVMAPWLVVDQGLSPMEALRKSNEMTMGLKWDLLGFYYVGSIVVLIGMLALYVGMVVSIPVAMIAFAALYRHLQGGKVKMGA